MKEIKIAPSILSADFAHLAEQVREVESAGADMLHIDVMDGHFVPNISIGVPVVKALSKVTKLPLDVHLMIAEPEKYIDAFIDAGAGLLTVHAEVLKDPKSILLKISKRGVKPGISLNPLTSLDKIRGILKNVDLVLIMTVNPGFGGQEFIESVVSKIKKLRDIVLKEKLDLDISVDGGINNDTAKKAVEAGADILVAGSAIFNSKDIKASIDFLRLLAKEARSNIKPGRNSK